MIKEFTVGVKHLVNLGSYENLTVEASVTINVDDDADWEAVRTMAQEALKTLLADSFKEQARPSWFGQIPAKKARG